MAFDRRFEPKQRQSAGLSRHVSLVARAASPGRSPRARAARAGRDGGRVGRPDARQRAGLRDPGAGAVEDRGGRRAAGPDDREPRARDGAGGGAAARAGHAPARRRGERDGRPALLRRAADPAPGLGTAVEVRARVAPAAAGDAAVVRPLQADAARQPDRRRSARGRPVHGHGGRRSQGRREDRRQPGRRGRGDPEDAGGHAPATACCARCRCTRATGSTSAC